jgi:hypothetical protein
LGDLPALRTIQIVDCDTKTIPPSIQRLADNKELYLIRNKDELYDYQWAKNHFGIKPRRKLFMSMSQVPDKIIYKGQNWNIKEYDYPMEDYFFKNPGKRPKSGLVISSCFRGYIASFSFIADELVLEEITVLSFNEDESKNCKSLVDIFENALINKSVKNSFITEKEPVFKIHWYNGLLTPMLDSKVAVIQLENGKIIKDLILDLKEYNGFRSKWYL